MLGWNLLLENRACWIEKVEEKTFEAEAEPAKSVSVPELVVNSGKKAFELDGRKLKLSPLEQEFLALVAKKPRQTVSKQDIFPILKAGSNDENVVRNVGNRLRKKLEPDPDSPKVLIHEKGGWKLDINVRVLDETKKTEAFTEGVVSTEFTFPDGRILFVKGRRKVSVLQELLKVPDFITSYVESEALALAVFGDSSQKLRDRLFPIIVALEKNVETINWHIDQPVGPGDRLHGQKGRYGLRKIEVAPKEEVVRKESEFGIEEAAVASEKAEVSGLTLPDGKSFAEFNLTELETTMLEGILCCSKEKPLLPTELAKYVYGEEIDPKVANQRVRFALVSLRRKLAVGGFTIPHIDPKQGINGYYLEPVEEKSAVVKEDVVEATEEVGKILEEEAVAEEESVPSVPVFGPLTEDWQEIPYEPSEEERRTEEEIKVLNAIVSPLYIRKPLDFVQIQADLRRFDVKTRELIFYNVKQLKEVFAGGFAKFRREAETPQLREKWSSEDEELWKKIQVVAKDLALEDLNDLKTKVLQLIQGSKRRSYGSTNGGEVERLRP